MPVFASRTVARYVTGVPLSLVTNETQKWDECNSTQLQGGICCGSWDCLYETLYLVRGHFWWRWQLVLRSGWCWLRLALGTWICSSWLRRGRSRVQFDGVARRELLRLLRVFERDLWRILQREMLVGYVHGGKRCDQSTVSLLPKRRSCSTGRERELLRLRFHFRVGRRWVPSSGCYVMVTGVWTPWRSTQNSAPTGVQLWSETVCRYTKTTGRKAGVGCLGFWV